MKRITDPDFRYTSSVETDLRKTFARVRREAKLEAERRVADAEESARKVRALREAAK